VFAAVGFTVVLIAGLLTLATLVGHALKGRQ
jgi:hypothetical protein